MDKKRLCKRRKARKPKFLSLRLQFPANENHEEIKRSSEIRNSKQLDLFPLHPEIAQFEDRDSNDHENDDVAFFYSAADGGGASLTGLLDTTAAVAASNSSHIINNSRLDDLSPSSASLSYAYRGPDSNDRAALVRNALRNRERDSSEEKWVCYSEVVKRKVKEEEEVTSSAVDRAARIHRLSLKLDYEEIMNAWSNKGPLYIDSDRSQIVPDINNDFLSHEGSSNRTMSLGCNVGVWTVPEINGEIENDEMRMKRDEELKIEQREASVLRYKEKRQNRLFTRTIRYQVRKLNAEKRPRIKGRFVKRS